MTSNKYPSYKESGEYWMGEIPGHWEIKKLKHIFVEKKKVSNPSLGSGSISFGKVVYKDDEKIPESTKGSYQEVLAGEYLVNPLNLNYDLISLRIGLSDINVVVSSGYIVLKNSIELNKTYFNYLLHRYDVAYMKLLGSGVRQTISFNHIANSLFAYPPLEEQTAIAKFLDDKTAKIDLAIAQKEKLIALFKERKQIIIQNAVTKGLDPNVRFKDSGVEWIGKIPEHWEVKKVGYFSKIGNGSTPNRAVSRYWSKDEFPWLNSSKVNQELINGSDQFVTAKALIECHLPIIEKGTILMAITGEGKTRGKSAICNIRATINQHLAYIKVDERIVHNFYLQKVFDSMYNHLRANSSGQGSTKGAITCDAIRNQKVILPPIKEQHLILDFITSQTHKHEKSLNIHEQQIQKLKEYKATLIDSAVTGKIRVSNLHN